MKIYTLHHPHNIEKSDLPPLVMALGFFDGVHLGHQQVIGTAVEKANQQGAKSAVMTFDPHPSIVLGHKHKQVQYITPLEEKIKRIELLGVDYFFVVRFTSSFAALNPQEFIDSYIIGLNVRHVVAGFDYTYGRLGKGTMETLPFHSREAFTFTTVEKLEDSEEKISSTRIRQLLNEGEVAEASRLLGRPYEVKGTVIHGDKRGRKIGFPTANIEVEQECLVPQSGVYAVKVKIKEEWYNGVCNIGYRPTFKNPDERSLSIEVHIFDFKQSIYGEEVTVKWYTRLRGEQKFDGIEALVAQIDRDKQKAIDYLKKLD
ncbi:bifunctional riboflavin kinase/FAD synthetase [Bacillus thermotolerans]|uniref:Riboflavin biosynthesis protein n=1 Tax=Bacillus thermotolerans TaxID=1221996 RepID=A0A0F5IB44_BACTR|nr:bifunctional riboflavin kinase/FAD synthetase [Bacillus thermotolerans]KKB38932.1 Riboflavin kinase [Bacillus thermotolerans]KKB42402.1 Riboflavin kinase [Bacillus thermotolerans]KKB44711.1 Riboflavin kinase [Bacillus thermotolerans]